ncbi:MAG: GHKL domain-containing protein [Lachnospiraceae bacterium]|nr:GHKL domain-containing protein [Lachnospiraceae bacterium]
MRDYVLDLAEYSARAGLLLFLCKDIIMLKEKYRSVGKILFFLQAFIISFWLNNSSWFNGLLYGEDNTVNFSSHSIVKLSIVFLCSFAAMDILYQGPRFAKLYLLSVYYMAQEMVRFTLYSVWSFGTTTYLGRIVDKLINEGAMMEEHELERYAKIMENVQFYSIIAFSLGTWLLMYIVFRFYRRYLTVPVTDMNKEGIQFLILMPIIGMAFDVSWRVTLYYQHEAEVEFLYERHGSMYFVVPVIALSCLFGIVLSMKIYSELIRSEEQKKNLIFYKQQLSDMTEHVKELEHLYDGIKGMRHDINNYVADMEQLLQIGSEDGHMSVRVRKEAEHYLRSMQQAASELSLQFSTGNPVTDVILNRKGQICAQEQITLEGELICPVQLGIEAFDLGIVLNNALDNAIEACTKIPREQDREIRFRGYVKGRMFFLVVENTYDSTAMRISDGELMTTKNDEEIHGLGMNNMRSCVEKYYGTMQYELGENRFILTIMLQGAQGSADL